MPLVVMAAMRVLILSALSVAACGGESTSDSRDEGGAGGSNTAGRGGTGASANCRVFASRFVQSGLSPESHFECSFDRPALTMSCGSDAGISTTETWATIEDAVTENRPPGNYKAVRYTTAVYNENLSCRFAFEVSFDSLGRALSVEATPEILDGGCSSSSVVYDAWDSEGRPIHGIANGVGFDSCVGQDLGLHYDDEKRVMTVTQTGGIDCLDIESATTFDADGIVIRFTSGGTVVYDNTTLETGEICVD